MGLHLNYELRLPISVSGIRALELLSDLRDVALSLPFKSVSAIYHPPLPSGESADRNLNAFQFVASAIARPDPGDSRQVFGAPATAMGFVVAPGDRCELATVGCMQMRDESGDDRGWFWHCCCKTQYASLIGDAHLVRCHTSLVRLLDSALECGMEVVVRDETHYWESRDEQRLIAEVRAMNQVVAAMAGRLSDTIGPSVHAPVFRHPDFERLEMGE